MSDQDKFEQIEGLEIEPLTDEDLETVAGGAEPGCSVSCTQSYSCQCGTGSCCGGCDSDLAS